MFGVKTTVAAAAGTLRRESRRRDEAATEASGFSPMAVSVLV
jgi:hypothetical protein